jgi:NitT/TauT family transport system ATP-binding protein
MPRIGTIRPTRPADIEISDLGKRYGHAVHREDA